MRYLINAQIYFEMAIGHAKWLYNRTRKLERKRFKIAMRKAAKWGSKPKAYHEPRVFKKFGRARP